MPVISRHYERIGRSYDPLAMRVGTVWLVGAGPGDPGLVTVRALELLRAADVVLYDALAHPALLDECRSDALLRDVGKRYGQDSPSQDAINRELIEHALAGKRVVRLKGGDPFLFARGSEEAEALAAAGVVFEVVPGVTSPVAAAAYAGVSLTHRELSSSVTFITGSDRAGVEWSAEAWKKLATATDTICVLMGMRRIEQIAQAIIDGGRSPSTPALVVMWGTRPEQRVVSAPLERIAAKAREAGIKNPAVIVVGEVASLREKLRWFDARPLFGKRVLVPRPAKQASLTARAIRLRGAEPVVFPLIEIVDPPDPDALLSAASDTGSYDWVVFTSANGVERFFAALSSLGRDARAFGAAQIGVIGPKTAAALASRGIEADLIAEAYVGESLADALIERGAKRVLVPRALEAREVLPAMLAARGIAVDVVAAYETKRLSSERASELVRLFESGGIDVALFTSSSTVTALTDALGARAVELLARVTVASIGPITSQALERAGVRVNVTAASYTVEGLLAALEAI